MANNLSLSGILCGLFTSATTLTDWYLNAPIRIRPFNEEELYRYELFLERPRRVLTPPDFSNDWSMVVLVAGVTFFLGYMSAKLVGEIYLSRFITTNNVYMKIIVLAGLIMGLCAGYILMIGAYMLPLVWKIYLAIATAMLTFLGTYLVLRSPYQMYLWWKQKRLCK